MKRRVKITLLAGIMACAMCVPAQAKVKIVGHAVNAQTTTPTASGATATFGNTTNTTIQTTTGANAYGAWVHDAKGWWWKNPDGTWPKNTWAWLDGNHDSVCESYYFGPDGYMLANTVTPDGYTVNANGAWTTDGMVQVRPTVFLTTPTTSGYGSTQTTVTQKTAVSSDDDGESSSSSSYSSYSSSSFDEEAWADEVIELVNKERRKAGKSELEKNDTLMEVAQVRAEEASEKFSHTRPDGSTCFTAFDEAGFDPNAVAGENIANGYSSPAAVMNGWMHSSGHKANILSTTYDYIGVGVYKHGSTYYWAQAFGGE